MKRLFEQFDLLFPKREESYALHEPFICGNEEKYINECLRTGWVSSAGSFVDRFESDLQEYTGIKNAIATVNGTAALHASFKVLNVSPGDEVLMSPLTFVATANAISYCNAVPHFVDVSFDTLGVCPVMLGDYLKKISLINDGVLYNKMTKNKISALCVTNVLGHPAEMDELLNVCREYNIYLIEDAAEGLGSYYKGCHAGMYSDIAVLSFNGNKIITAGGGGALLTNNDLFSRRARHLSTTAKKDNLFFVHDEIGYNYRMPNVNAAIACAQLESIDRFLVNKRWLAEYYQDYFSKINSITIFRESLSACSNYWLNALFIKSGEVGIRDDLIHRLNAKGIGVRPFWKLMHQLPMYENCPRMSLVNAEEIYTSSILLPSGVGIAENFKQNQQCIIQ